MSKQQNMYRNRKKKKSPKKLRLAQSRKKPKKLTPTWVQGWPGSVWMKWKRLILSFVSQQSSISHGNIGKYFISKIAHQELPDELITPNGSHFNSSLLWQISLTFYHRHTSSKLPPADPSDSFCIVFLHQV